MISIVEPISNQASVKPRCLVLLAAFNGMRWLPEQVSSILAQEVVNVQLVISVDRSTDGTECWVDEQVANHSQIKALPHGHRFGGAARNFYRLMSDVPLDAYDYVALSDQDDIWMPDKLAQAIWHLQDFKAEGYSSNVLAFWPDGKTRLIHKAQAQVQWDYLFEAAGPGCTYVVTKQLAQHFQRCLQYHQVIIQSIGLHDWFLYAFARANHYRWIIDPMPHLHYRQHANNQVGTNVGWAAFQMRAKKVLSGWAMAQTGLIAKCIGMEQEPMIKEIRNGSRLAYLRLMLKARQCRRKVTDQMVFALMCLAMVFWKRPHL